MDHPNQARMLLYRWSKAGNILALKKGVYMTSRFYERYSGDPAFTAAISAILVPHSYLSLEFVLQRHAILTDVTYPITAITTKNTKRIVNWLGTFWYRSIRPDLYRGFVISEYHGIPLRRHRQPRRFSTTFTCARSPLLSTVGMQALRRNFA
jgi:hypothetical protein